MAWPPVSTETSESALAKGHGGNPQLNANCVPARVRNEDFAIAQSGFRPTAATDVQAGVTRQAALRAAPPREDKSFNQFLRPVLAGLAADQLLFGSFPTGNDAGAPNSCLVAERRWDAARWAIKVFAWRFVCGGGAAVLPAGPADAHHPPQARTTPAVRAEIAHSTKSSGVLAKRYGVSTETFRKWRKRGPDDEIGERLEWDRPIVGVQRVFVQDPEMPRPRVAWCSHYAHRSYAHEHHGDLHLYGRSHGRLPGTRTRTRTSTSLDVGVDCWDWTPVRLEAILKRIAETPETDPVA